MPFSQPNDRRFRDPGALGHLQQAVSAGCRSAAVGTGTLAGSRSQP